MKSRKYTDALGGVVVEEFDLKRDGDVDTLRQKIISSDPLDASTFVSKTMEDISNRLLARGWPELDRVVRHSKGEWAYADKVSAGQAHSPGWAYVLGRVEVLSSDWSLAKVYKACLSAQSALQSNDINKVFLASVELSRQLERHNIRVSALQRATVGKKSIDGSARSNAERKANNFGHIHGNRAEHKARALLEENPRRTWGIIQLMLANEFNVSERTIRKYVANPRKS